MVTSVDERDEQMAIFALGLTTILLGVQAALLVLTMFMPLAGIAAGLADEEPTAPPAQPAQEGQEEAERPRPVLPPVLALVGAGLSAALAAWAAVRLYRGTIARHRWTWVLVLSGVGCGWGIIMARFLSRVHPPFWRLQ